MKNLCIFLFLLIVQLGLAQKKMTFEEVTKSTDTKVLSSFIKENPNHPGVPELKKKLVQIITNSDYKVAKPEVKPLTPSVLKKQIENASPTPAGDANARRAAEIVTNLFSNNRNKSEVYVQIINNSPCNMIVKFEGKDFYNLNVLAGKKSFILIKKGKYTISTLVCDVKYSQPKLINEDIYIKLGSGKR